MKKMKEKIKKQKVFEENGLTTNYYEMLKGFVYGIEKNPIKIPAQVKEQIMVEFLDMLLSEVIMLNSAEGVTSNASKDLKQD